MPDDQLNTIPNSEFRIPNSLGLYIHVPFCFSKCPYCDFYSARDLSVIPSYCNALREELSTLRRAAPFAGPEAFNRPVRSVYFGGGTPSLLPPAELASIMETVRARYALLPGAEVTLEVNPTLGDREEYFAAAAAAGINRVSVGLQSALAGERKALGRRGAPEDAVLTARAARQAGIGNLSVDLMLGIPGQTLGTLRESLGFALENIAPTHLSLYILKLEQGTPFYKMRDRLALPDDDAVSDLYEAACAYLRERGMRHYEISNFCFDGLVGVHNLAYWQGEEYLGFGPAAHSYYGGKRFYYERDTAAFIAGASPLYDGPGGDADETLMLALRTDLGLDLDAFRARYALTLSPAFINEITRLQTLGLLTYNAPCLRLTEKGFLLSNSVISSLLAAL